MSTAPAASLLTRFVHLRWMLALAVIAQLTGAVHLATEYVEYAQSHEHCDNCGDDDQGLPCPPLCTSCLGAHAARPALPFGEGAWLGPTADDSRVRIVADAHAPEAPPASDIFRPPSLS